jgi:DNA adenine methylase
MKIDYLSPLRYPGAKRRLVLHIETLLIEYGCENSVLVEPCCGGASVSLYLLKHNVVSSVILADKDPWVASFWKILFTQTDDLLSDIRDVEVTVETWKELRGKKPLTEREKAFYCFFFNRTCYSGILDAGMIGGNRQASDYKIDCRFNKPALTERIKWIADHFASKVQVREASVFDILNEAKTDNHDNRVYYIDPPYIDIELYPHNFKLVEHQKLKNSLDEFRKPWILSYHEHSKVLEMYGNNSSLERTSHNLFWVVKDKRFGKELLISNLPAVRTKRPLPPPPPAPTQVKLWINPIDEALDNVEILTDVYSG